MAKKSYYTGAGLAIGTGIGGAIGMTLFALTGNAVFIAFSGLGTALGLAVGAGIDAQKGKEKQEIEK